MLTHSKADCWKAVLFLAAFPPLLTVGWYISCLSCGMYFIRLKAKYALKINGLPCFGQLVAGRFGNKFEKSHLYPLLPHTNLPLSHSLLLQTLRHLTKSMNHTHHTHTHTHTQTHTHGTTLKTMTPRHQGCAIHYFIINSQIQAIYSVHRRHRFINWMCLTRPIYEMFCFGRLRDKDLQK